jgi:hypothetical protein
MKRARRRLPITQLIFATLRDWGWVNHGTTIVDTSGERYVVHNQAGIVALRCLTQGQYDASDNDARAKDKTFESLDGIDHSKFRVE